MLLYYTHNNTKHTLSSDLPPRDETLTGSATTGLICATGVVDMGAVGRGGVGGLLVGIGVAAGTSAGFSANKENKTARRLATVRLYVIWYKTRACELANRC